MKQVFIYLLFDENGPRYVGKTVCTKVRRKEHEKTKPWLVELLVIEVVPAGEDWQARERFWISYYRQWFDLDNKNPGGNGPGVGHPVSEETKLKIGAANSVALKGRVPLHFKGIKHTADHIAKLPQNQPGYAPSSEAVRARADGNLGKKRSPEARLRMSLAHYRRHRILKVK